MCIAIRGPPSAPPYAGTSLFTDFHKQKEGDDAMARTLNRVEIIGYLGSDPDIKEFSDGIKLSGSVATNRLGRNPAGEPLLKTDWNRFSANGKLAEQCRDVLRRGSHIRLEGRLETRTWKDATGSNRSSTEIIAYDIMFLDPHTSQNADAATDGIDTEMTEEQ